MLGSRVATKTLRFRFGYQVCGTCSYLGFRKSATLYELSFTSKLNSHDIAYNNNTLLYDNLHYNDNDDNTHKLPTDIIPTNIA